MGRYDCVIFDLDGTVMDTSSGILSCIDYIVERFQLEPLSEKVKRSFIGPPIQNSFQMQYNCTQERAWELAAMWREAYKDKFLLQAVPYEGIYDLLRYLRQAGIKTAVSTNKREDYTVKLLDHFSFIRLFDCIIGSDFAGNRSKTDMISLCMEQLGIIDPTQCLMVGDTIGDLTAAQEAGVDFLGVTYGFGFKKGMDTTGYRMVDSCREIQCLLQS